MPGRGLPAAGRPAAAAGVARAAGGSVTGRRPCPCGCGTLVDPPPQPCACGCGQLVPYRAGRREGQPWYSADPACRRERARIKGERQRRAQGVPRREREPRTCERCGRRYSAVVGSAAFVDMLCSAAPCRREHKRRQVGRERVRAGLPAAHPPQPCGACQTPVPWSKGRIPGRGWWHSTAACERERVRAAGERARERARPAPKKPVPPPVTPQADIAPVDAEVAARAAARVRMHVTDPAEVALVLAMLGLADAGSVAV